LLEAKYLVRFRNVSSASRSHTKGLSWGGISKVLSGFGSEFGVERVELLKSFVHEEEFRASS
jgi:hypothetical protein